jgi:hypothetical protein
MSTDSDFSSSYSSLLGHEQARPRTMAALLQALHDLKCAPVVSLATALAQLGLLAPHDLEALAQEDPDLLRSRSRALVRRLLVTSEGLHHALARAAGLVEVDAARFELPAKALGQLPLRTLRAHGMLFLGEGHASLMVAAWNPTREDLHRELCALTGRSVTLVWADRDAIDGRLDRLEASAPGRPTEQARRLTLSGQSVFTPADLVPEATGMPCLTVAGAADRAA